MRPAILRAHPATAGKREGRPERVDKRGGDPHLGAPASRGSSGDYWQHNYSSQNVVSAAVLATLGTGGALWSGLLYRLASISSHQIRQPEPVPGFPALRRQ